MLFLGVIAKFPKNPKSEKLKHKKYWGTRQQLLAGKVICDWLCEDDKPPMDPIFGVLLNPTAGEFKYLRNPDENLI